MSTSRKPPDILISDYQWGKKLGQHAQDWGLDPSIAADRKWLRDRVEDIAKNYDEVRQGAWHPTAGGASDYIFYRQGTDIVVAKSFGEFVTVLRNGAGSSWFRNASPFN